MAKKALFPLDDPPTASSSDEDDDVISISEEDEPNQPVTVNASWRQEDSDSESKHAEDGPEVTPNPISYVAARSSGQKRRSTKSGKRLSWSEDDEITLLQRMIDFNADTGTNPLEDRDGFFDFVEKDMSFDVSKSQVGDKLRSLKRKFTGNKRSFSKGHDKECLRLAQFVWAPDGMVLLTSKKVNHDKQVFSPSGSNKAVEEGHREVSSHSVVDKAVEEGHTEVSSHRGQDSGKRLVAEDEPEVTPNPRSDVGACSSGKKRRSERTTSVIAKRTKTGEKLSWSEADEITLLQRMIDFNADTGTNPFEDRNGFFDFVEKDISFDVSKSQVGDKIRSLKRKFTGNKRAQPSSFSKDHDKECLRLAEFVWGPDGMVLLTSKKASDDEEVFSPSVRDKEVEEEGDREVSSRSGRDKEVEEADREVFSHGGGDKAVEEGVKEVFSHKGEGLGKRLVADDEVLAHVGEATGKMAIEEEDEVLARSRGVGDSEWFEKSLLVQSVASFGLAEHSLKERWSSFSAETKKKLEHEWKLLESKELHVASLKTKFMSELGSMYAQAI